ncbi:hypothetical protein J6P92_08110 [bacterium]|nr:hypothetical protein [bacterium]
MKDVSKIFGGSPIQRTNPLSDSPKVDKTTTDVPIGKTEIANTGEGWGFMGVNLSTNTMPEYKGPESLGNFVDYLEKLNV